MYNDQYVDLAELADQLLQAARTHSDAFLGEDVFEHEYATPEDAITAVKEYLEESL